MNQTHIQFGGRLNVLLAEDRPHAPEYWITQLPRLLEPQGIRTYIVQCGQEAVDMAQQVQFHAVILDLASPSSFSGTSASQVALRAQAMGRHRPKNVHQPYATAPRRDASKIKPGQTGPSENERSPSVDPAWRPPSADLRFTTSRAHVAATSGGGRWMLQLGRLLPNCPPVVVVRGRAYSRGQVEQLLREALHLGIFSVVNAPVHIEHLLVVLRRIIDQQYRGHWPAPPGRRSEDQVRPGRRSLRSSQMDMGRDFP